MVNHLLQRDLVATDARLQAALEPRDTVILEKGVDMEDVDVHKGKTEVAEFW